MNDSGIYKICKYKLSQQMSLIFCFFSTVILTMTPYFKFGGSAEEFALPFIFYNIYLIFRFQSEGEKLPSIHYFLSGLAFSWLFWMKFTMIGSWIGFYLAIAIIFIIQKKYVELFKIISLSIASFLLLSLSIILYFSMHDALYDLIHVYFYSNIVLYQPVIDIPIAGKLVRSIAKFIELLKTDVFIMTLMGFGLVSIIPNRNIFKNNFILFLYFSSYFTLIISTFFGGNFWAYYCLIIFPFFCVSLLPIVNKLNYLTFNKMQTLFMALVMFVLILGFNLNIVDSKLFPNNSSISTNPADTETAQQEFAKIMNKDKNPTLLNYGVLDMGFYQAANILPSSYYFEIQNIKHDMLPQMRNAQKDIINKKQVMYVVTRTVNNNVESDLPKDFDKKYELVGDHSQTFENLVRHYRLYRLKE